MVSSTRAQGTIEYLVVIAIVVVIGLVVVGLLSGLFQGQATNVSSAQMQINQLTQGISIIDAVVDPEGDGIISLQNNSGETLTLTKISSGSAISEFNKTVSLGERVSFEIGDLAGICSCSEGESKKTCSFDFEYLSSLGLAKKSNITISIDCVSDSIPIGNVVPRTNNPPVNLSPVAKVLFTTVPPSGMTGAYTQRVYNNKLYFVSSAEYDVNFGGSIGQKSFGTCQGLFIARYGLDGSLDWVQPLTCSGMSIYLTGFLVDSTGIYLYGNSGTTIDFGGSIGQVSFSANRDFFLAKFDYSGVVQWVSKPLSSTGEESASKLFIKDNLIYALMEIDGSVDYGNGVSITNTDGQDFVIVKYNLSGVANGVFSKMDGTGGASGAINSACFMSDDYYVSVSLVDDYNFGGLVGPQYYDGTHNLIVKYNSAGVAQSLTVVPVPYTMVCNSTNLFAVAQMWQVVDFGGSVGVVDFGSDGSYGIVKYDSSLNPIWVARPLSIGGFIMPSELFLSTDSIYFTGSATSRVDFDANTYMIPGGFLGNIVAKYSISDGNFLWNAKPVSATGMVTGYGITESNSFVYASGLCEGTVDFGGSAGSHTFSPFSGDFCLIKYSQE